MKNPEVGEIIKKVPLWSEAKTIKVEALEGLTNTNYAVTVDGELFVLRVSGRNTERLGVNRELEVQALLAASQAGIAPQVVYYLLPEGHLVTRFIDGHHLTIEEYRTPENIQRIVEKTKQLHNLPLPKASFSPFQRVEEFTRQAQAMGVTLPPDFETFLHKMAVVEKDQKKDSSSWKRFCHNDLFCVNVIDNGMIWFLDWEFSGAGDLYYDLATLFYAYDSPKTLPRDLQEHLLECYFGKVKPENWHRLEGMQYMLMFFSAMWGLLQQGMQNEGLVRAVEGFSFMEYAETTFDAMREAL